MRCETPRPRPFPLDYSEKVICSSHISIQTQNDSAKDPIRSHSLLQICNMAIIFSGEPKPYN